MNNDTVSEIASKLKSYSNLIINADDFGKNKSINDGIIYCYNNEIINSISIMANEEGTESAIKYIKGNNVTNIGIHINLTEGFPLGKFENDFLFDEDGRWDKKKYWDIRILKKEFQNQIETEINLQIDKILDYNIQLTHINSHHHIHTTPFLLSIFLKVAINKKIKLRLAQTNKEDSYIKFIYRIFINNLIKSNGIAFSDYFENISSWNKRRTKLKNKKVEIMVHPSYTFDYSGIIDTWENNNFIEQLELIILEK